MALSDDLRKRVEEEVVRLPSFVIGCETSCPAKHGGNRAEATLIKCAFNETAESGRHEPVVVKKRHGDANLLRPVYAGEQTLIGASSKTAMGH